MKLQYRHNNGYTYLFAIDEENEHAEIFYMDGSDDFPVLSDEQEITAYLSKIAPYIDQWSGADDEMDGEKLTDFLAWLKSDENNYDVCDAEIEIAEMVESARAEMKTYYILTDMEGYGSEYPVCVDRAEAERLCREWNDGIHALDFDEIWREASEEEIAQYGRYDTDDE